VYLKRDLTVCHRSIIGLGAGWSSSTACWAWKRWWTLASRGACLVSARSHCRCGAPLMTCSGARQTGKGGQGPRAWPRRLLCQHVRRGQGALRGSSHRAVRRAASTPPEHFRPARLRQIGRNRRESPPIRATNTTHALQTLQMVTHLRSRRALRPRLAGRER